MVTLGEGSEDGQVKRAMAEKCSFLFPRVHKRSLEATTDSDSSHFSLISDNTATIALIFSCLGIEIRLRTQLVNSRRQNSLPSLSFTWHALCSESQSPRDDLILKE